MALSLQIVLSSSFLLFVFLLPNVQAIARGNIARPLFHRQHGKPKFKPGPWRNAEATFYGGADGSGTKGGACGYEGVEHEGYGLQTVSLSDNLFNRGLGCGACYEVKCGNNNKWCKPGQPSINVTTTNQCGGTSDHFDLTEPAFLHIAQREAGVIPIQYRRVPCNRQGGIRFSLSGNPHFNLVSISNVGGAGEITNVQVKGDKKLKWTTLNRSWGQKWQTDAMLQGESLSFRVTTSDGKKSTSWHVVPADWKFNKSYQGKNYS